MILDVLAPTALWWLALTAIGWAAVPIVYWLLPTLSDRGLALARPIGLVLLGYGYWLAGLAGLLPNSRLGATIALALFVGIGLWAGSRQRDALVAFVRRRRRLLLGYEALFLVVLVGWAVYRAYTPNIEPAGGEKYMEMAFINAILQSPRFPPLDPWLSGFAISYYYFGYVQSALLVLLTGLSPSVAFNLVIPSTLAMTCVAAFGVGHGLVALAGRSTTAQRVVGGAVTAVLVPLAGSLVGLVELGFMRGWGSERLYTFLGIKDLTPGGICNTDGGGFGAGGIVPSRFIWWWRGSRVIHDDCGEVIHEFPFFSFMLGDVHPHVMALPYVLVVLGIGLAVLAGLLDREADSPPAPRIAVVALLVGALGFLNTWDLPTFGAVVVLAYALRVAVLPPEPVRPGRWDVAVFGAALAAVTGLAWRFVPTVLEVLRGLPVDQQPTLSRVSLSLAVGLGAGAVVYAVFSRALDGDHRAQRALSLLRFGTWLALLSVALYAPFYIGFRSQASGIGFSAAQSRPAHWLVHFGLLFFLAVSLAAVWLPRVRATRVWWPSWLAVAAGGAVAVVALFEGALTPALAAVALGAVAFAGLQLWASAFSEPDGEPASRAPVAATFAMGCVALGLLLALVPEFVFVRDLFNSRMNTVFKLFYQAWVLLALGGAFAVTSVWRRWRPPAREAWLAVFGVLAAAAMLYPLQAIATRTDRFAVRDLTLDGLASWQQSYPADLAAANWLRANAPKGSVILEAYGGAYEHNGRISMATGLPAVLGWEGHEHQWRGTRADIDPRKADIETMYTTRDETLRNALFDQYDVRYVVLSDAERSKFQLAAAQVDALEAALDTVFESPSGRLVILERR